jgi:hypothetical protein
MKADRISGIMRWFASFLGVALLSFVVWHQVSPTAKQRRFEKQWKQLFTGVHSPDELQRRLSPQEWSLVLVKRFADGTWVMATGASVPGGDSFDATLVCASNGRVMLTEYRFSGFEGLDEYLSRISATSAESYMEYFAKEYHAVDLRR